MEGRGMSNEVRRVTGMCEGRMRFDSLYFFYYFLSMLSSFLSLLEGTHSNFLCYLSRVTLMWMHDLATEGGSYIR
jgi:hypothetical protein